MTPHTTDTSIMGASSTTIDAIVRDLEAFGHSHRPFKTTAGRTRSAGGGNASSGPEPSGPPRSAGQLRGAALRPRSAHGADVSGGSRAAPGDRKSVV